MADVEVLLATYDGERFLREQIESILSQEDVGLRILARDDGSHDGTAAILAEYAAKLPGRFRVLEAGVPAGSAKGNFLRLMEAASAEYVCFADQDDVWLPGKVRKCLDAMRALEREGGGGLPLLVFSDLRVVDEQLRTVAASMWAQMEIDPESVHRLERLLGQSVVTGCTAMINRAMLELALAMPDETPMHDRWISLLAAAMGRSAGLPETTVLYRQHGRNVIGVKTPDDSLRGMAGRVQDSRGRRLERLRSEQEAECLLRLHGAQMPERTVRLLQAYLRSGRSQSAGVRVWTTLRCGFFRGTTLRNLALLHDLLRAPSHKASHILA